LKVIDERLTCSLRLQNAGLNGASFLRNFAGANDAAHSVSVHGEPRGYEERLRPLIDGVEDFIAKPFLVKDLVRIHKKSARPHSPGKIAKRASRPALFKGGWKK